MKYLFCVLFVVFMGAAVSFLYEFSFVRKSGPIHVDNGVRVSGTGHALWPVKNLDKALLSVHERTEDGVHEVVLRGSHTGQFWVEGDVQMRGEKDTTIFGALVVQGDVKIFDLRIQDGRHGIFGLAGTHLVMMRSHISDSDDIGLYLHERSSLEIIDSIITHNRKGVYILRESQVKVSDSTISHNVEEGMDLRASISLDVRDSKIMHNGEGGIEYILGNSKGVIAHNMISNNVASGVSLQFYKGDVEHGDVDIIENDISHNGKYGVKCGAPQGGKSLREYFAQSTDMRNNKMKENGDRNFSRKCNRE